MKHSLDVGSMKQSIEVSELGEMRSSTVEVALTEEEKAKNQQKVIRLEELTLF